jgi:hypothetical protein
MTKRHHLNYLSLKQIKVKGCQKHSKSSRTGDDNIFAMMRLIRMKFGSNFINFGDRDN